MIDAQDISESTLKLLAFEALARWPTQGITGLLNDPDPSVRTLAARELHTRGAAETFDNMRNLCGSRNSTAREIGAFVLGQLGTPDMPYREKSFPILKILLKDECKAVKAAAAAALGHLSFEKMPDDIEIELVDLLKDESDDVRCCAAYALGNSSGSLSVRNALKQLKNDEISKSYATLGLKMLDARKNQKNFNRIQKSASAGRIS